MGSAALQHIGGQVILCVHCMEPDFLHIGPSMACPIEIDGEVRAHATSRFEADVESAGSGALAEGPAARDEAGENAPSPGIDAELLLNSLVHEVAQAAIELVAHELSARRMDVSSSFVVEQKQTWAAEILGVTVQPDASAYYVAVRAALRDLPDLNPDHVMMCASQGALLRRSHLMRDLQTWDPESPEMERESKEWDNLASVLSDIVGCEVFRPCEDTYHHEGRCQACLNTGVIPPAIGIEVLHG